MRNQKFTSLKVEGSELLELLSCFGKTFVLLQLMGHLRGNMGTAEAFTTQSFPQLLCTLFFRCTDWGTSPPLPPAAGGGQAGSPASEVGRVAVRGGRGGGKHGAL